jgi:hemolysin activation/secretion protein
VFARGGLALEDYHLGDPTSSRSSVEDVYTPATAPGVGVDPTYLHSSVAAGFDWRPAAGYARSGGLYEISHHRYDDRDDTYSFNRVDVDLVQHFPILRENWVISLHGALQTTLGDTDLVPYYLLPSIGGGSSVRGYSSWRFRDRHAVLSSAEFRWIASRLALDMAVFYDAGTVASEIDRLTLREFVSSWGFGARFHGPTVTPLRIELASGREGVRLVFASKAAF